MKKVIIVTICLLIGIGGFFIFQERFPANQLSQRALEKVQDAGGGLVAQVHPLSIDALRNGEYPGSDFVIEQQLDPGVNYTRAIVSYKSEGLKIYGLLTVPSGQKPATGWPVVIFNHGYIAPSEYRTTERYVAYQDTFARNGYITFKSDYRGHGNSEGQPAGGYGSNGYTIDVLNGLASVKRYPDTDKNRIGLWGHSMGGFITLRSMVARDDIKAGVIWAGVVADYPELINNWRRRISPSQPIPSGARRWRDILTQEYGEPDNANPLWKSLSANNYLHEISGPVQIHHGTADTSVPVAFSQQLEKQLQTAGKTVEYYEYPGDDHNLTANFNTAIQRSLEFFDTYVKNN
ncbi:MAG TPA: alpha/beta fold hydrolase [Candidatus Levybacteria bacterium]|nr:alpha/beta fold hydrolase [Candidatus Levybacteria bacterium]